MDLVDREHAEHYRWGGVCDGWHLLQAAGLSVIEERVPPGGAEVRHHHARAHQFFYVLAGQATLEVAGQPLVLRPRQGLAVTPGVPHRLVNAGPEDLCVLVISAPPSHGDRVSAP